MKTIRLLLATVLSGVIISFAQIPKTENSAKLSSVNITDFSQQLDDIFNDPNFSSAQCGVVIQSLATGEYLYKRNEDKLFIPASNMKLFTTATALTQLGPQYRFKTEVYSRGTMDGSILVGDIIFRGFGDPTISGRLYNEDITKVFSDWVDSLLELGIDEIRGRIIGDDNAFDDIGMGENWSWDDETEWYSAPAGALSLNDNCVDIFIKPTSSGDKAKMEFQPLTKYLTLIHNVITVPRDSTTAINVYRERGTNVITVTGTIAEGRNTAKYHSSINNPT